MAHLGLIGGSELCGLRFDGAARADAPTPCGTPSDGDRPAVTVPERRGLALLDRLWTMVGRVP